MIKRCWQKTKTIMYSIKKTLENQIDKESSVETNINNKYYTTIRSFDLKGNIIKVNFMLHILGNCNYKIESIILKLRNERSPKEHSFKVYEKKCRKNTKEIFFELDIKKIEWETHYWDFYILVIENETKIYIRINNPIYRVNKYISSKERYSYQLENNHVLYPYFDSNKSLSLTYRMLDIYETPKSKRNEKLARFIYIFLRFYFIKKNIWLIHEKFAQTAQDNAFYFYKYCIEKRNNKNVFFVIKKDSPDYKNIDNGLKQNVIPFMSVKHIILLYACKFIISSEAKGHGYIWRANRGRIFKLINGKNQVFLQHGVLGLKRIGNIFDNNDQAPNRVKLFVSSSEYEKKIIKKYFGYDDYSIAITGLARWDYLISTEKKPKQILLMPTFRNWLEEVTEDTFLKSNYYKEYKDLLSLDKLHEFLFENKIKLKFYIHPKLSHLIGNFQIKNDNVMVISADQEKLNTLLSESSLLITDYSSVAWDMFYMKKPVIFYQFDYEEYQQYQGSYIDMHSELIGDRVFDKEGLIKILGSYQSSGFRENKAYADLRGKYIKYIDQNNCSRIYESILLKEKDLCRRSAITILKQSELVYEIWRLFSNFIRKRNNIRN